jgi:hypothetical protein
VQVASAWQPADPSHRSRAADPELWLDSPHVAARPGLLRGSHDTCEARVLRTGRPMRRDNLQQASDSRAAEARQLAVTSAVGTPSVVEDRLWGGMAVSSKQAEPLPADTESRISRSSSLRPSRRRARSDRPEARAASAFERRRECRRAGGRVAAVRRGGERRAALSWRTAFCRRRAS